MNTLLRVLLILACFELGILLLLAPWSSAWEQNYFTTHYPSLIPILLHPSARGIISGLGVLDIILAAGMIRRRAQSTVVPPA
jgi:hypothetical protein